MSNEVMLPEKLQDFIQNLHREIRDAETVPITHLYQNVFNELTESYFKNDHWPSFEDISPLIKTQDELFRLLYNELYYRHIFVRLSPSVYNRIESLQNYFALFDYILDGEDENKYAIPDQWLWDIIDEFLYQFQAFCQYRINSKGKNKEELEFLKEHSDINVGKVINYLESIVEKSGVVHVLEETREQSTKLSLGTGSTRVRTVLGYFSLIGLLRIHSLLGDYYTAIKSISALDLRRQAFHAFVPSSLLTLHYYVGFGYMMMRRYNDAAKVFYNALSFFSKSRIHTRSYQYQNTSKMLEQVNGLLAMCITFCPQRLDESVLSNLKDKFRERYAKMQRQDENTYEEVFSFSCPKFIIAHVPTYDGSNELGSQEPLNQQRSIFMEEVQQQLKVATLRSFLKLYSSISLKKLAGLMGSTSEETRQLLMLLKHKSHQLTTESLGSLSGNWTSSSEVAFYLEDDVVHLTNVQRYEKNYAHYFLRQISRLEFGISELKQNF
eukprot:gb/GECH01013684.1/.p1 GENE.gb/GECH01013684.1/~~gb/GECH01013684.1/.p1  ORF type:complete len:495 (+),score=95.01 gb/GECH01013684.1/:1-1485(+)